MEASGPAGRRPSVQLPLPRCPCSCVPLLPRHSRCPVGRHRRAWYLPTLGVPGASVQCAAARTWSYGTMDRSGGWRPSAVRAQKSRAESSGMVPSDRPRASSHRARRSARSSSPPRGSTTRRGAQAAATSSSSAQMPDGHAGQVGGAEGGGLEHRGDLDRPPAGVGQRLGEDRVGRHAPVDPERRRRGVPSRPRPPRAGRLPGGPPPRAPPAPARAGRCPGSVPTKVPRAPKSHTGVPSPSRAGTNQTSPVSSQRPATSAESAAESMMARSSRSHSTQVPADSMMASTPQVIRPRRRQAMMGMVPGRTPGRRRRAVRPRRTGRACPRCRRWPWPAPAGCSPGR